MKKKHIIVIILILLLMVLITILLLSKKSSNSNKKIKKEKKEPILTLEEAQSIINPIYKTDDNTIEIIEKDEYFSIIIKSNKTNNIINKSKIDKKTRIISDDEEVKTAEETDIK